MGSKQKIGVRIDAELWKRFKRVVEDKHGRTRGVTADEVESALRNHIDGAYPTDRLARIENDVATIKAQLAESDGGEVAIPDPVDNPPARSNGGYTHTQKCNRSSGDPVDISDAEDARITDFGDTDTDDDHDDTADLEPNGDLDKPHEKAPKSKKAEWVFQEMNSDAGIVVNPKAVETKVRKAWGFGTRATDDILSLIYGTYHALPVRENGGDPWHVALGQTEDDRDDAIAERFDGDDYEYIPAEKYDDVTDIIG